MPNGASQEISLQALRQRSKRYSKALPGYCPTFAIGSLKPSVVLTSDGCIPCAGFCTCQSVRKPPPDSRFGPVPQPKLRSINRLQPTPCGNAGARGFGAGNACSSCNARGRNHYDPHSLLFVPLPRSAVPLAGTVTCIAHPKIHPTLPLANVAPEMGPLFCPEPAVGKVTNPRVMVEERRFSAAAVVQDSPGL